jgi:hypothetical protein
MTLARCTFLVLSLIATSAAAEAPRDRVRRFAFLAGVNDGGAGRIPLRYATTDARAMSRVLMEMGGVRSGDLVFAEEPSRAELVRQLDLLRQSVASTHRPEVRSELIFYYSGHSDEEGLLLRGERLPYPELRARIEQIPADVRVAVLDSCASGALTRRKGGVFRSPFLNDESVNLTGNAFLTSSAANEVAQESDRIAASFFTHFLVSGLRGAADANRDRKVTFFEAYQFAAQETLARTERTQGGAQHAAYDIALNGTGDLVMTSLREGSAGLVLQADLQGFISVRESDSRLVAELRKAAGHPVELGLEPGKYLITMAGADAVFVASVELRAGERAEVSKLRFHPEPLELARARGDAPVGTVINSPALPALRVVPFSLEIITLPGGAPERLQKRFTLSLLADRTAQVRGAQLSLGINWVDEEMRGLQWGIVANIVGGPASGLQASVGGNYALGDVTGMQASVGANLARSNVKGLQGSVGLNQVSGNMNGVQAAAGANWVSGDLHGLQATSGFNGVRGTMHGMQVGIVNYGGETTGLQLGLVNVAGKSRGLQLGLVNYADEDQGTPIGLISYARRNGILALDVYGSETTPTSIGLKIGGRSVYNTFAFGARPGRESNRFTTALGLGARARFDRSWLSFLDTEVVASSMHHSYPGDSNHLQILSSLRLLGGWKLAGHFAIQAGPTLNVLVRERGFDEDIAPGALDIVLHDGAHPVSMYPGFVLGMEI